MQAGNDNAVCAVKAAGNAHDHRRTTAQRPIVDAITAGEVRRIDLLRLTIGDGVGARTQHAHSYIGMGLTPALLEATAVLMGRGGAAARRSGGHGYGAAPSVSDPDELLPARPP